MFSTILDISSFFIGMLINLLLIALICYYFKRKYEALELSQNEQAKILYNLINSQSKQEKSSFNINELITNKSLNTLSNDILEDDLSSNDDSSDDESSDNESVLEENNQIKTLSVNTIELEELPLIPNITVTKIEDTISDTESLDYNKLSIKQLKDILSKKGINSNNRMKKNDLIQLIEKGEPDTLDLKDELSEVNI
jgi:hypothetical protein